MKYLIILLLLLLPQTFAQDNFYIDRNGWCLGLPVPFTIYNESEWNIREEIEDDEDINFSKLSFEVTIFDGPFDLLEPIYEKTFKDQILPSFDVTFKEEKPYLIEIKPTKGNFSQYEEKINIQECRAVVRQKNNLTLDLASELTIEIENTEIKNSELLKIEKKDNADFELDNEYKIYEFSGEDNLSGEVTITLDLEENNDIYEVYLINKETNELTLIDNAKKENNKMVFSISNFGIFSLFQAKNQPEEIIEEIEELNQVSTNTDTIVNEVEPERAPIQELETKKSILDFSVWIILGIIVLLFIIFAPKLLGTKTQKETYHEERDKDARKQITSSKEAYEKTKEYVVKYKNQYPRESIEKALKASGVTDEIIKLVFSEEY